MTVVVEENPTQVIVSETGVEVITVGISGVNGVGVPAGGTTGQVLAKASNTNYDTEWVSGGGGGGGAVDSVNGQTGVVVLDADDIDDTSTTHKFTTASDISKLAGIEAGADVTDTTNVNAAGAVMNSDYAPSHSILVQQSGTGSPTALSIGNNTLVGRLSGGGSAIDDLSVTDVRTLLSINNVDNTSDADKPISTATQTALDAKQPLATVLTNTTASFTTAQESKLAGIAAGAEVNVNADWNASSGDAQILNKPTLGTASAQDVSYFATAAQGALADSALQSGDNISELNNDANYITASGAPVQSVNGATGTVVLDADDIDDTSTTHKFATAAQLAFSTWQQAISALATNTVALDASDAMFQTVTWEAGSRTPTFTGFDATYRSFILEINVTGAPTIAWTNVDNWLTDSGSAPTITGLDVIRVLFDSYDSGTTINATLVGSR